MPKTAFVLHIQPFYPSTMKTIGAIIVFIIVLAMMSWVSLLVAPYLFSAITTWFPFEPVGGRLLHDADQLIYVAVMALMSLGIPFGVQLFVLVLVGGWLESPQSKIKKVFCDEVRFVTPAELNLTLKEGRATFSLFAIENALQKMSHYGPIPRNFKLSKRDEESPRIMDDDWREIALAFCRTTNTVVLYPNDPVLVGVYTNN